MSPERRFLPPWSVSAYQPIKLHLRVDNVDNFPQVSAATAETRPANFLNELGSLIFTTHLFAEFASSLLRFFSNGASANHDETRRP